MKRFVIQSIIVLVLAAGLIFFWINEKIAGPFIEGRALVTQGLYEQAVPMLDTYLTKHPRGRYASRALFFIAKAQIGLGDLQRARLAFRATIDRFPDTKEAKKSRYKLAMIDLWEGETEQAVQRLESLAENPDGPLAPEARAMHRFLSDSDGASF